MIPFSSDESVARYVARAQRERTLERDEEIVLFRRFREQGDARAAEVLARSHLRHVVMIAQKYGRYGLRPAELIAEGNFEGVIRTAIGKLDTRERYIVEHRLMADREDELSLAEMGRRLGVSRERARQLEERAKKKLRGQIRERYALTL